tara:strand:+ start:1901 stop:2461 length:561 start_codon:yes stop_codon:yes gene_type:complete
MQHFYKNFNDWFNYPDFYQKVVAEASDPSHFVEIGTYKGASAAFMGVEIINSNKKITFDTYDIFDKDIALNNQTFGMNDNAEEEARKNLLPVKDFVNIFKSNSIEASKKYKDESLDFVFIDGSHLYEDVLDDINHWYPKVKKGGILSGHDLGKHCPQVELAVSLFCKNNKQSFIKESSMCWRIDKP